MASAAGGHCLPTSRLPWEVRPLFPYEQLNPMQTKCFSTAFESDRDYVVSAPTGSGKTVVLELAMARLWLSGGGDGSGAASWSGAGAGAGAGTGGSAGRRNSRPAAVYVAPLKALTSERHAEWAPRLAQMGRECYELTGDVGDDGAEEERQAERADLILTTPEKWDAFTRFRRNAQGVVGRVGLLLVDEIHLLTEEHRGPTLESVIARMKLLSGSATLASENIGRLRIIAISATMANIEDIARWISHGCEISTFDDKYRPVPLNYIVVATKMYVTYNFDALLSTKVFGVVRQYSNDRPTLVFCNSRSSCAKTAAEVAKQANGFFAGRDPERGRQLSHAAASVQDRELAGLVRVGIGFYHAGLSVADKRSLERLFTQGLLPVLCSTSGLAVGVNLPAHLVIICNTCQWANGGWEEYSRIDVLQMAGRAGRPQYDTSGTCVLLTRLEMKAHYEGLLRGMETIESHLHTHMKAHLNAEIASEKYINSVDECMSWLKSTFLFVRIKRNPPRYNLPRGLDASQLEDRVKALCMSHLQQMERSGMVTVGENASLQSTRLGWIAARYCVEMETMGGCRKFDESSTVVDVLDALSRARELEKPCALRRAEKVNLGQINASDVVRFPIMDGKKRAKCKTAAQKAFILLQLRIAGHPLGEFHAVEVVLRQAGCRILRAFVEHAESAGLFSVLNASLGLHKALKVGGGWADEVLSNVRQFDGVGRVAGERLLEADSCHLPEFAKLTSARVEFLCQKSGSFVNTAIAAARSLIASSLTLQIELSKASQPTTASRSASVTASAASGAIAHVRVTPTDPAGLRAAGALDMRWYLLVGDAHGKLLLVRKLRSKNKQLAATEALHFEVRGPLSSVAAGLTARLVSVEHFGVDVSLSTTPTCSPEEASAAGPAPAPAAAPKRRKASGAASTRAAAPAAASRQTVRTPVQQQPKKRAVDAAVEGGFSSDFATACRQMLCMPTRETEERRASAHSASADAQTGAGAVGQVSAVTIDLTEAAPPPTQRELLPGSRSDDGASGCGGKRHAGVDWSDVNALSDAALFGEDEDDEQIAQLPLTNDASVPASQIGTRIASETPPRTPTMTPTRTVMPTVTPTQTVMPTVTPMQTVMPRATPTVRCAAPDGPPIWAEAHPSAWQPPAGGGWVDTDARRLHQPPPPRAEFTHEAGSSNAYGGQPCTRRGAQGEKRPLPTEARAQAGDGSLRKGSRNAVATSAAPAATPLCRERERAAGNSAANAGDFVDQFRMPVAAQSPRNSFKHQPYTSPTTASKSPGGTQGSCGFAFGVTSHGVNVKDGELAGQQQKRSAAHAQSSGASPRGGPEDAAAEPSPKQPRSRAVGENVMLTVPQTKARAVPPTPLRRLPVEYSPCGTLGAPLASAPLSDAGAPRADACSRATRFPVQPFPSSYSNPGRRRSERSQQAAEDTPSFGAGAKRGAMMGDACDVDLPVPACFSPFQSEDDHVAGGLGDLGSSDRARAVRVGAEREKDDAARRGVERRACGTGGSAAGCNRAAAAPWRGAWSPRHEESDPDIGASPLPWVPRPSRDVQFAAEPEPSRDVQFGAEPEPSRDVQFAAEPEPPLEETGTMDQPALDDWQPQQRRPAAFVEDPQQRWHPAVASPGRGGRCWAPPECAPLDSYRAGFEPHLRGSGSSLGAAAACGRSESTFRPGCGPLVRGSGAQRQQAQAAADRPFRAPAVGLNLHRLNLTLGANALSQALENYMADGCQAGAPSAHTAGRPSAEQPAAARGRGLKAPEAEPSMCNMSTLLGRGATHGHLAPTPHRLGSAPAVSHTPRLGVPQHAPQAPPQVALQAAPRFPGRLGAAAGNAPAADPTRIGLQRPSYQEAGRQQLWGVDFEHGRPCAQLSPAYGNMDS